MGCLSSKQPNEVSPLNSQEIAIRRLKRRLSVGIERVSAERTPTPRPSVEFLTQMNMLRRPRIPRSSLCSNNEEFGSDISLPEGLKVGYELSELKEGEIVFLAENPCVVVDSL